LLYQKGINPIAKTKSMKINYEQMSIWEVEKASYLILIAKELGMQLDSYGEVSVNQNSGYTYIWLEDFNFSLYMPINCDLKRDDVYVLHTDFETGDETEESLSKFKTLDDIEEWASKLNLLKN
jgi:hypothetical protein